MELPLLEIDRIIKRALKEDIGSGDITTESIIPEDAVTKAYIYSKEDGVIAGLPVAKRVFELLDAGVRFTAQKKDGDRVKKGDILAEIEGSARAVLTGERTALNILQRLSGIATRTFYLAEKIKNTGAVLVDTRKTTPGFRVLEKYAVRVGGGKNHRFGLFDAILIKDNHIKVAGGIEKAVSLARQRAPHTIKIEVEVENLEQLKEALEAKADIIMLDNMPPEMLKEAVKIASGKALLEVSGGVNEDNIKELALAGIDLISAGVLTHSVKSMDISLDVGEIK